MDGPDETDASARLVDERSRRRGPAPPIPIGQASRPPTRSLSVDHWDEVTAAATPDERARRVADFVAASKGLETAGFCSTSTSLVNFQNSAGHVLTGRTTHATFDGIARTGTADGSGRKTSVSLATLNGREIGTEAERRAREASNPTDLEPGRYEVILEPECVANLLSFLLIHGFNGKAVEEGRSFARLGETQFDPSITLRDDVTDPATVGIPFDVEGTPKRPLDLVSAGVTSGLLHNRRTARKAGAESTGHAVEGRRSLGPVRANLFLSVAGDASADELVAGVERGSSSPTSGTPGSSTRRPRSSRA